MARRSLLVFAAALAFTLMLPARAQPPGGEAPIDSRNFVRRITNDFFPLAPGTTYFYRGEKDGTPTVTEFAVTRLTKRILGVSCVVVRDRAFEDNVLQEETLDWFAQDRRGNVWYFGEATRELDPDGNVVSTEGSWEAGVDGARPGIIMEARPRVGDRYFQEMAADVAEDQAQVLRVGRDPRVPHAAFREVLQTAEFTRLRPGVLDQKFYVRRVGFVLGVTVRGGNERTQLIRIERQRGAE